MCFYQSYINKRGIQGNWFIQPTPTKKYSHAIVIPSYCESNYIKKTLDSIQNNSSIILKDTLVIVVINNSTKLEYNVYNDNFLTVKKLSKLKYNFTLGYIDAFSKGLSLPKNKAGVGMARKIGMDLALQYLNNINCIIFSLDADSIVHKNYMKQVISSFRKNQLNAAVVGFCHSKTKDKEQNKKIKEYEKFLIRTAKNIKNSTSPYGYVSMGSTIICRANAYIAVGGMPSKKATEDFYFLQELTKYCGVYEIDKQLVFPSSRYNNHVYLGTGFRMSQMRNGLDIKSLYYSDLSFVLLKEWLVIGTSSWKLELDLLFEKLDKINSEIKLYLIKQKINFIWNKLNFSSPTENHFIQQFHRWFDALKTLQFLKYFTKNLKY